MPLMSELLGKSHRASFERVLHARHPRFASRWRGDPYLQRTQPGDHLRPESEHERPALPVIRIRRERGSFRRPDETEIQSLSSQYLSPDTFLNAVSPIVSRRCAVACMNRSSEPGSLLRLFPRLLRRFLLSSFQPFDLSVEIGNVVDVLPLAIHFIFRFCFKLRLERADFAVVL